MHYCWKPFATWMPMQAHCSNNERKTQRSRMSKSMSMAIHGCSYDTLNYICSPQLVTNQSCVIVLIALTNCARKRMASEHHLVEHSAHSALVSGNVAFH